MTDGSGIDNNKLKGCRSKLSGFVEFSASRFSFGYLQLICMFVVSCI